MEKATTRMRTALAPLTSLCLLVGMYVEARTLRETPANAGGYHAHVLEVAGQFPFRIGDWVGVKEDPPASAIAMLRPNTLMARRFTNSVTGERASVVFVQCADERDMGGHYPPHCYPAHGWKSDTTQERRVTLPIGVLQVPVTAYRYRMESSFRFDEIVIYNFFVRPDGSVSSGREAMRRVSPRWLRPLGAAQVQVVLDGAMPDGRCDEVFVELMEEMAPVVGAVLQGGAE